MRVERAAFEVKVLVALSVVLAAATLLLGRT